MKTTSFRKWYIPGIISAIFTPLLFYTYGREFKKVINIGVIQIYWFDPELIKNNPEWFTSPLPAKRNYIKILLTGEKNQDKIKLDFSQIRLREILSENDSINGIHYSFGDSSVYWSFIKALDICQLENAKTYIANENNLWVYHIPIDTTIYKESFVCGNLYDIIGEDPSIWIKVVSEIKLIWNTSWHIILGATSLFFFPIYTILKKINGS